LGIGIIISSMFFSGVYAFIAGQYGLPGTDDPGMARMTYTAGISSAYLFTLAIGIMMMAGEFRHQTMTATALAVPRRHRIVLAKLGTVLFVGTGYGLVAVLSGTVTAVPILAIRKEPILLFGDGIPRALALAVLAVALWAVLGLGIGTLIRNQIVALLVAIGVAWLGENIVTFILTALDFGNVAKFLPGMATAALISPTSFGDPQAVTMQYLPWWAGALVLFGYAAIAGVSGMAVTLRRDIH
jgi:ABC-type transport system involved in multi-copper enzyme maturation permease subunit